MLKTSLMAAGLIIPMISQWAAASGSHAVRDNVEQDKCEHLMEHVYKHDVIVPDPPHIIGEWVSRRCEVRSGPEFLLRKYKFTAEGHFDVHQFYYSDSSCRKPAYLLVARGTYRMGRSSFLVPGSRDMEYSLATVTVMPYTDAAADMLGTSVNVSACDRAGKSELPWKPYQRYEIFSYLEVDKRDLPPEVVMRSAVRDFDDVVLFDVDCTEALGFALHELQLVRLEMRARGGHPHQPPLHHNHQQRIRPGWSLSKDAAGGDGAGLTDADDDSKLLMLGDVHTDRTQRQTYRPSGFQEPLAASRASNCQVCRLLADADDYYPPMLTPVAMVEPVVALSGSAWFSERCEVPAGSMATTRHVRFAADNRTWEAYQHYFADPTCRHLMFTVYVRGLLTLGPPVADIRATRALDLAVDYATVTAHDERIVSVLGNQQQQVSRLACGLRPWKVGLEQDVTMTGGCPVLGLRVPHTERQVVRVERHDRHLLVLLGQTPTPNGDGVFTLRAASPLPEDGEEGEQARPTSFAPPLVRCGHPTGLSGTSNTRGSPFSPVQHFDLLQFTYLRSNADQSKSTLAVTLLLLWFQL